MATPRKTVKTVLAHYDPVNGPKDMHLSAAEVQSYKWIHVPAEITDFRSCEEEFTLDKTGFQLVKHKTAETSWRDYERVQEVVYPEVVELLKKVTGATFVKPVAHTVRESTISDLKERAQRADSPLEVLPPGPATNVHVDQSDDGAVSFCKNEFPEEEFARLSKTRWGIINVWRALAPVTRDNLVLGDSRSFLPSQLHPVPLHFPRPETKNNTTLGRLPTYPSVETWRIAPREDGKANDWYYASGMTPEEVLLIKCFDSKKDGRARLSPHAAFQTEGDFGPARRSCEIRCLVFWEDEAAE